MNAAIEHPEGDTPVRISLALLFLALTFYVVVSIFRDPFPYPVREIAGGAVLALVLVSRLRGWRALVQTPSPRPYMTSAIRTSMAAIFAYVIFRVTYFDPLPKLAGSILGFALMPLTVGAVIWSIARSKDDVYRASAFESFAWGALVGVGLIYTGIFALRYTPSVSEWLQTVALAATNGLSPAAVGFGLGAAFSIIVVWFSLFVSWAIWWARKR